MKIRITGAGIFGIDGEIKPGTELEVKDAPAGWVGRYEVVTNNAPKEAKMVANPARDDDKPARRSRPKADD